MKGARRVRDGGGWARAPSRRLPPSRATAGAPTRLIDRLVVRVDEQLRAQLRRAEVLPMANKAAARGGRLPANLEPSTSERHDAGLPPEHVGWILLAQFAGVETFGATPQFGGDVEVPHAPLGWGAHQGEFCGDRRSEDEQLVTLVDEASAAPRGVRLVQRERPDKLRALGIGEVVDLDLGPEVRDDVVAPMRQAMEGEGLLHAIRYPASRVASRHPTPRP